MFSIQRRLKYSSYNRCMSQFVINVSENFTFYVKTGSVKVFLIFIVYNWVVEVLSLISLPIKWLKLSHTLSLWVRKRQRSIEFTLIYANQQTWRSLVYEKSRRNTRRYECWKSWYNLNLMVLKNLNLNHAKFKYLFRYSSWTTKPDFR